MQEQMNRAMAQLSATVGEDVPTFEEIREKIEARSARAQGMAELQGSSVESRMLEVEQAQINAEAQARLSQLRTQLGLPAPAAAASRAGSRPATRGTGRADDAAARRRRRPRRLRRGTRRAR